MYSKNPNWDKLPQDIKFRNEKIAIIDDPDDAPPIHQSRKYDGIKSLPFFDPLASINNKYGGKVDFGSPQA